MRRKTRVHWSVPTAAMVRPIISLPGSPSSRHNDVCFDKKNVRLLGDVDGVLRRWYQTAADINRAVKPLSTTRFPNTTWRNISRARSARFAPAPRLPDRRPSLFASLQHFRCSLRWRTKIGLIIRRLVLTAPSKTYTLNPVPTWLVKRFVDLLPGISPTASTHRSRRATFQRHRNKPGCLLAWRSHRWIQTTLIRSVPSPTWRSCRK